MFKTPTAFNNCRSKSIQVFVAVLIPCSLRSLLPIIAITTALITGCGRDKTIEPELPPAGIETSALSFISPIAVELTGKVINEGPQKIIDHGFIYWFGSEKELSLGVKVSLGADIVSGFYKTTLTGLQFAIVNGVPDLLVAKAYVTDKTGTRYGQIFSNNYDGQLATGLSPTGGKTGDIITVNGNYAGLKASDIKVIFANVQTEVKTITNKTITVAVPNGIPVGHGQKVSVKVQVGVVSFDVHTEFPIWANIKDINPKSGPIGTKVTFTGDNLPFHKDGLTIGFSEQSYGVNYFEDSYFVRVPSTVLTEKVKLYAYRKDFGRETLPFEFSITPPVIKSITPNPALSQQELTIHMENTEPYYSGNEPVVNIANFTTYVRPNDKGDLVFKPEFSLKANASYSVKVTYGPHTVTAPVSLSIVQPEATGFSPHKAFPGEKIHVTGRFLEGKSYLFDFINDIGGGVAVSNTDVVITVPMPVENKAYKLTLKDEAGDISIPGTFEGQATRFDAVSPVSGKAGTTITITGEGIFDSANIGFTTYFEGVYVRANSISLKKLELTIPENTSPGTYPIKLSYGILKFDTGLTYTVTK